MAIGREEAAQPMLDIGITAAFQCLRTSLVGAAWRRRLPRPTLADNYYLVRLLSQTLRVHSTAERSAAWIWGVAGMTLDYWFLRPLATAGMRVYALSGSPKYMNRFTEPDGQLLQRKHVHLYTHQVLPGSGGSCHEHHEPVQMVHAANAMNSSRDHFGRIHGP